MSPYFVQFRTEIVLHFCCNFSGCHPQPDKVFSTFRRQHRRTHLFAESRSRKVPYEYDKALYRQRHKVENLFAKLKDWRRVATRYDRCAHTFFSAICIAAAVIFWL